MEVNFDVGQPEATLRQFWHVVFVFVFVDTNLLFSWHLFSSASWVAGSRSSAREAIVCMLVFVLYGFALGLCEGGCVYVHDILCMTMLIVTTTVMLVCDYDRFVS